MRQNIGKTKFWVTLGIVNLLVMMYPIILYVRAEDNNSQLFAGIILACVLFVLVIIDAVSALVAYLGGLSGA